MSARDRGFARAVKDGGVVAMGREVGREGMGWIFRIMPEMMIV